MTWKDEDEVVTTYGSLQLGLEQAHAAGVKTERERIIKQLIDSKVMRIDALGILCFVNCDTLKVEYSHLFDDVLKGAI